MANREITIGSASLNRKKFTDTFLLLLSRKLFSKSGNRLAVLTEDWIGTNVFVTGDYEKVEFELALALCDELDPDHKKLFFDVGANIGVHSTRMLRRGYEVVAFEPNPLAVSLLKINVLDKASVVESALGENEEKLFLEENDEFNMGGASIIDSESKKGKEETQKTSRIEVEVSRLDRFREAFGAPGVIKIDVEGHEAKVLRGAKEILENDRPLLIFEQLDREFVSKSETPVLSHLSKLGYLVFTFRPRNSFERKLRFVLAHVSPIFVSKKAHTKIQRGHHNVLVAIPKEKL